MHAHTHDTHEFFALLPAKGRLMALDVGTKTIGLALSDAERIIASPLTLITRRKLTQDLEQLAGIIAEHKVVGIVIGYPVNMDGSEGPRCQATRQFTRDFGAKLALPILLADERLSTVVVNRMMTEEADLSRARRGELVDKLAATYLLQGVLDSLK
jgi:putative Holliday junction resolvase